MYDILRLMNSILKKMYFSKRHNFSLLAIIVLCVAFFIYTSFLAFGSTKKFDSPDETSNYLITKHFAQGKGVTIDAPLTTVSSTISPRSFAVQSGVLLPGSFLGMVIVYGTIARVLGEWILLYLTPLFSTLALLGFFFILRRVFDSDVALFSTFLLAIHPAFWYWSSRGMYHNAFLVDVFIFGMFFLVRSLADPYRRISWLTNIRDYGLSGIMIGTAVAVRTSEIVWILGAIAFLWMTLLRGTNVLKGILIFMVGFVLALLPVLYINTQVYGQPLSFGYAQETIETTSIEDVVSGLSSKFSQLIFPFGIHPENIGINFWNYGVVLFWLPTVLSVVGFVQALRKKKNPLQRSFLLVFIAISLWLIIFYGSWNFHDNPDPSKITIGTSYTRYWLPLYVFGIPYAGSFIIAGAKTWVQRIVSPTHDGNNYYPPSRLQIAVGMALVFFIFYSSVSKVLLDSEEGLATVRAHTIEYRRHVDRVLKETPDESVIIAGRADKVFFPERNVIVGLNRMYDLRSIRKLLVTQPVYVYISPVEAPSIVRREWNERGFLFTNEIVLSTNERLFRIEEKLGM